jgi:hypothetical protein
MVVGTRTNRWSAADEVWRQTDLLALTTNATSELHVLRHDGDALGMDGAEGRVLEQTHEVRLTRLLQRQDGGRLEATVYHARNQQASNVA